MYQHFVSLKSYLLNLYRKIDTQNATFRKVTQRHLRLDIPLHDPINKPRRKHTFTRSFSFIGNNKINNSKLFRLMSQ